ncbi:MAG: dihydroneopterin aldolase [Bacteroidales bacterium]|nr:dihydroneopterin aldolase [Bacteroidales bacterium]
MGRIVLGNMQFHSKIGVSEEEQINGNDFTVNISFEADTQTPGMSDNIEDAIDYSIVYELIKQEMNISAKLIENVAYRIMKRLKVEIPQIGRIQLSIYKNNPPLSGKVGYSGIEING